MCLLPRDVSDDKLIAIVRDWVDVLAREDYEAVFAALGYGLAFDRPGPDCIRDAIKRYRSPDYYPDVTEFSVTSWREARGGNPEPSQKITWYKSNGLRMAGAVSFDLPLNGRWSDLTADFVLFENEDASEGHFLNLEEIGSIAQMQREQVD